MERCGIYIPKFIFFPQKNLLLLESDDVEVFVCLVVEDVVDGFDVEVLLLILESDDVEDLVCLVVEDVVDGFDVEDLLLLEPDDVGDLVCLDVEDVCLLYTSPSPRDRG